MVTLFTLQKCIFCDKLKAKLNEAEIEFKEFNIDYDKNKLVFEKLVNLTQSENVPTIIVGKQILAPNKSFNTIDEAFEIIQKLLA